MSQRLLSRAALPRPRTTYRPGPSDATLLTVAAAGATATVVLGAVLHDNTHGVAIDQWFQSLTREFSAQPGQPGFHYRPFWLLSRALRLGRPPGILGVAGIAALVGATTSSGLSRRLINAAAPFFAILLASGTAEWILKPVVDRRMAGNLSVECFPSGHSVGTAAVAGTVVVLLARRTGGWNGWERAWLRRTAVGLFVALSAGIGLDMATLRSHFLTDVVAGWLWGAACSLAICVVAGRASSLGHRERS